MTVDRGRIEHDVVKPLLRGRIHLAALVAAIPAGFVLVAGARPGEPRLAAAVYAASLVTLYAASSAYHRLGRNEGARRWLRRLDHSSIYVLIAGSYTPVCLLVLDGWWGHALLVGVWGATALGVVLKLARFEASRRFGAVLYVAMGWAVLAVAPALVTVVPPVTLALLVAGGVIYTVGAVVLLTRVPNPFPRVFGYHEVWHTMVVLAGALHFAAILQIVHG